MYSFVFPYFLEYCFLRQTVHKGKETFKENRPQYLQQNHIKCMFKYAFMWNQQTLSIF